LDDRDDVIEKWVDTLEHKFGLVFLTEAYDEGLLLVGRHLGLTVPELMYLMIHVSPDHASREVPTDDQVARLEPFLHVDNLIYARFNKSFWRAWEEAGGYAALGEDLGRLRSLNAAVAKACPTDDDTAFDDPCLAKYMMLAKENEFPHTLLATKSTRMSSDTTEVAGDFKAPALASLDAGKVLRKTSTASIIPKIAMFALSVITVTLVYLLIAYRATSESSESPIKLPQKWPSRDDLSTANTAASENPSDTEHQDELSVTGIAYDSKETIAVAICVTCTIMFLATGIFYWCTGEFDRIGVKYGLALFASKTALAVLIYYLCYVIDLCVGITQKDIELIHGPRSGWSPGTIERLMETYGERKIKILDCINRRISHVVTFLFNWGIFIPYVVPNQSARVLASMIDTALKVLSRVCYMTGDGLIAMIFFRGTRVRDGRLARWNLVVVYFVSMGFFPMVTVLILHSNISAAHAAAIMGYCWQPNIWGDAIAELVGSFFGRLQFTVNGFGEINTKTVEGVIACWVSSFLACLSYASSAPGFPSAEYFCVPISVLHMLVAGIATIMETVCFRGTDNGFMVLSSALVVLSCYAPP
jgi:hypothetical protein